MWNSLFRISQSIVSWERKTRPARERRVQQQGGDLILSGNVILKCYSRPIITQMNSLSLF